MRNSVLVVGVLLLSGCAVGRNIKQVPTAVGHTGAQGWAATREARYGGEVLSVTDSSIVVLDAAGKLKEVPAARVVRVDFRPFLAHDNQLTAADLTRLRRASRFPYGIPEAVLATLLDRAGQTSIQRVD